MSIKNNNNQDNADIEAKQIESAIGEPTGIIVESSDEKEKADNKESVEKTLKEISQEKKTEKDGKRHIFFTILFYLFFPFTFTVVGIRFLARKISIPLSGKMIITFTLIFAVMLIGFTIFFIVSVENTLVVDEGDSSYIDSLQVTSGIMIALAVLVFAGLVGVASSLMLNPIRKITQGIDKVTTEDLSARLEVVDTQDELMELTNRINLMLSDIEETFNRQHNFISDASHELKTPIAVMSGYSNMLLRWGAKDPIILQESIDAIIQECGNMTKLVERLLLLAKLGKITMQVSKFNLDELIQDIIEGYEHLGNSNIIKYKGVKGVIIETDKNLIIELIRCLIDNACKYSEEGSTVNVAMTFKDDKLLIKVSDNGIGISKEDLPKVFDRFYRCDKSRARENGSSGLGLTIAKSITDTIGGKIKVNSTLGKGTTFIIELS